MARDRLVRHLRVLRFFVISDGAGNDRAERDQPIGTRVSCVPCVPSVPSHPSNCRVFQLQDMQDYSHVGICMDHAHVNPSPPILRNGNYIGTIR